MVDVLNLFWPSISSTKGSVLSMNPDVAGKSEIDTTVILKETNISLRFIAILVEESVWRRSASA